MSKSLQRLNKMHYDAMYLRINGASIKEIAATLNKHEQTIRDWFYNQELFKEEYERMKDESLERAKNILVGAGPAAAKRLVDLLHQQRGGQVNLNAAESILNRIGLKEIKVDTENGKTKLDEFMDKLLNEIAEEDKDDGDDG